MSMLKIALWLADDIPEYVQLEINELCEFAGYEDVITFLQELHLKYSMDLTNQITWAYEYKKEREE